MGGYHDYLAPLRLSLWDSTGSRRLEDKGVQPRINIAGGAFAEPVAIVDEVRKQLGFDVAFLRVASKDVVEMECLVAGVLPSGFAWRRRDMHPAVEERAAWERPGWLAETMPLVDLELTRVGFSRTGPPVQGRHTRLTAILRIPTDRHPVWLKALLPIFAHEGVIIRWLTEIADRSVPTVLAATPSWWLAAPFPEPRASPSGDFLVSLARMQIAAASRVVELRALGCPERPLSKLASDVSQLVERPDLVGSEERKSLHDGLPKLAEVCQRMDSLGFPATITHGDLSPANVRWTRYGWFLYDWTDICITHPFVELASALSFYNWFDVRIPHPFEGLTSSLSFEGDADTASRAQNFASVWEGVTSPLSVELALQASPIIGAAHLAANYRSIVDGIHRCAREQISAKESALLRYWVHCLLASLHS